MKISTNNIFRVYRKHEYLNKQHIPRVPETWKSLQTTYSARTGNMKISTNNIFRTHRKHENLYKHHIPRVPETWKSIQTTYFTCTRNMKIYTNNIFCMYRLRSGCGGGGFNGWLVVSSVQGDRDLPCGRTQRVIQLPIRSVPGQRRSLDSNLHNMVKY